MGPYGLFLDSEPCDREASSPARGDTGRKLADEVVGDVPLAFFLSSSFRPKRKKSLFLVLSSAPEACSDCCCAALVMDGTCEESDVSIAAGRSFSVISRAKQVEGIVRLDAEIEACCQIVWSSASSSCKESNDQCSLKIKQRAEDSLGM